MFLCLRLLFWRFPEANGLPLSSTKHYQLCYRLEVFVFNTNLTFLTFLYNIDIGEFWKVSAKIKNHHWIRILMPYSLSHSLPISEFQTLIQSCSIESRNDPSPKSEVEHETKFSSRIFCSTHVWMAEWNIDICLLNSWWLVLWVQFPLEATLFLLKLVKTLGCTEMPMLVQMSSVLEKWAVFWDTARLNKKCSLTQYSAVAQNSNTEGSWSKTPIIEGVALVALV